MKLIFGMQPYFDPTRKDDLKKNGRRPQKMEDDLKKNKNGRQPQFRAKSKKTLIF